MKSSQILMAAVAGVMAVSACSAQEPAKTETKAEAKSEAKPSSSGPVAVVNGVAIPQARLDLVVKGRAAQGQPDSPEVRKNIREDLINREIIAQEAAKKGLDKNPEIATQIELAKQEVLVRAYLQDYLKNNPPSDEEMKKEYEQIKAQMGEKEYKARHILVETEAEAKTVISQLKKGAKFEKLAADKSKDSGSKSKGGELEWSPAANYVKPFADALAKLNKGQLTQEPVQSQYGWHVIKLDDVRPMKFPSFEEVKPNLQQHMQQQRISNAINELRAKARVE